MGIRSMVQFTARVAVFTAVTALLSQFSCTISAASVAHMEAAEPAGSGCHEVPPATPSAPDQGHVCCGGEHSPAALLSAPTTTAISVISRMHHVPAFDLAPLSGPFAAPPGPSCGPPVPFALRI
ncbi:MAG TPA: hypothetical protein VFQ41_21705 [Candidatus Angelobacter sp.]|nr:hypothetical protein [Candidatus Angelobacter sp.]